MKVKVSQTWKESSEMFAKVSGSWKPVAAGYTKVNGAWKEFFSAFSGTVDLGLPSGKLWASGNIVSDGKGGYKIGEETDYGAYLSWGNVEPHFSSNGSTFDDGYNWGSSTTGAPYKNTTGAGIAFTTDSKQAAYPANATYDAARSLLGGTWRMPTSEEFKELYDNTDTEWTTINNVAGRKFMKKTDHSVYIFLPAGGAGSGTSFIRFGTYGYYWTSSLKSSANGYYFRFTSSAVTAQGNAARYYGYSVRAIMDAPNS